MSVERITPVILCGGSGTRLWPLSRKARPKPFQPLIDGQTLFERALARCSGPEFGEIVIVTGAAHLPLVGAQRSHARVAEIIVEPMPRQTAAAVAVAALRLPPEAVMLVCPSDHHVDDVAAFVESATAAADLAEDGFLVCFGIVATAPETRFGYLHKGEPLSATGMRVSAFVEKPDAATARHFLQSGDHFWNGGIFAMRAGDYLAELGRHRPEMASAVAKAVTEGAAGQGEFHPAAEAFARIEAESIDYAVMEETDRAAMVIADMGWSDVGDWPTVHAMRGKDGDGNSVRGRAELIDCHNCLVQTDGPRVSAIGLDDIFVIVDGDEVVVTRAPRSSEVARLRGCREE